MILSPVWSTTLSLVFLVLGALALYVMLVLQGSRKKDESGRLRKYHRLTGWLFIFLFLVVFILMVARVEEYWEETSARIALHVAMAVALFFLLVLKVLIARFFPGLQKYFFQLGTGIYLLAFTLVWITAGYYLVWKSEDAPYLTHGKLPEHMPDMKIGKQIFIQKCSTCHLLRNIMQTRSAESWEKVINKMVKIAEPRITPAEGTQILYYLTKTHTPETRQQGSVLEKYCLPCHDSKSEILVKEYDRSDWKQTVKQMREYGPEIIPAGEIETIVDVLVREGKE